MAEAPGETFCREFDAFLAARTELDRRIDDFIATPSDEHCTRMHAATEALVECAQRAAAARSHHLVALARPRRASSDVA